MKTCPVSNWDVNKSTSKLLWKKMFEIPVDLHIEQEKKKKEDELTIGARQVSFLLSENSEA